MRDEPLYVVMQPEAKNSFWAQLIHSGIREAAGTFHDTLCAVAPGDLSYDLKGRHALVVGNNVGWVERSTVGLMPRGFPDNRQRQRSAGQRSAVQRGHL